jgi:DNA replication protein DnaC
MLSNELKTSLTKCLKELHLPTVRACYEEEADRARREAITYEYYLAEVMEREREVRRHNRIQRLLRESKLPLEKSLEAFEMKRLSSMLEAQVNALLEGSFVERSENVLAFGNPGSGKTHLLVPSARN